MTITLEVEQPDPPPLPVGPPTPLTVIGTNVNTPDLGLLAPGGRNAGSRFVRTFSAPGQAILPWSVGKRAVPTGVVDFHSWKDWPSDTDAVALVTRMLDTMPAQLLADEPLLPELGIYDPDGYSDGQPECDGISFLVTYFHEGEPDFIRAGLTAAEWRRRHRLVYRTIRQHHNGRRVAYVPIQTLTWTDAVSTPTNPKGDRDPVAWWAGVGDYAGWDCYAPSVTTKPPAPGLYPPPAKFLTVPLDGARATGRQLFVPELGVIRQGAPVDLGAFRAAWMVQVAAYLADQGTAGVGWWDAVGNPTSTSPARDFRLVDSPSRAAWQEIIAGRY
jgi:hypothetical protein